MRLLRDSQRSQDSQGNLRALVILKEFLVCSGLLCNFIRVRKGLLVLL